MSTSVTRLGRRDVHRTSHFSRINGGITRARTSIAASTARTTGRLARAVSGSDWILTDEDGCKDGGDQQAKAQELHE